MAAPASAVFFRNFLGHAPVWYKQAVIACLLLNPLCFWLAGPVVTGWLLVAEFIFTLAMALKCYPLLPGGLLAAGFGAFIAAVSGGFHDQPFTPHVMKSRHG